MLERKIDKQFIEWKNSPDKKCLLVKGARQVGKTFSIEKFCKEHYKHYIYINFAENTERMDIFGDDLSVDRIKQNITLRMRNVVFKKGETILFLDEIQLCPGARTALKFLAIAGEFDVIASGSLLGIKYKEVRSFPVGYVNHLEMHGLDFEEFCWAMGVSEEGVSYIKKYFDEKKPVPTAMHTRMLELFKQHIVVGGMPAAVHTFVTTNHYGKVLEIQKGIIDDYLDDIAKYAEGTEKTKARACFLSVPGNLAKDHKKFQYSVVEKGAGKRKYEGSLMWIYDAGIVNFCYNLSIPELPLQGNVKSDEFKVYMRDTGLLTAMLDDGGHGAQKDIIDGNLGIYKGAIYENTIADIFTKLGKKLYYFEIPNRLEVDFIMRYDDAATAVEVKSADNTKSKSMAAIMGKYGVKKGIKLSAKNVGTYGDVDYIPLYATMFL